MEEGTSSHADQRTVTEHPDCAAAVTFDRRRYTPGRVARHRRRCAADRARLRAIEDKSWPRMPIYEDGTGRDRMRTVERIALLLAATALSPRSRNLSSARGGRRPKLHSWIVMFLMNAWHDVYSALRASARSRDLHHEESVNATASPHRVVRSRRALTRC